MVVKEILIVAIMLTIVNANIQVANGVISSDDPSCNISANSMRLNMEKGKAVGVHFGVIDYSCEAGSGYIISKLECAKCGLYCDFNTMIEGCSTSTFPVLMGCIIGLLFGIVIMWLWSTILGIKIMDFLQWTNYRRQILSDKIVERRTEKVNSITKMSSECTYNNKYHLSPRHYILVQERRDKYKKAKAAMIAIMLMNAGMEMADACDKVLFVTSSGMVCQNQKCSDNSMLSLTAQVGNHLCFQSTTGEITQIEIKSTTLKARYTKMYSTMDYTISIETTWSCKNLFSKCWNGGCLPGEVHEIFENRTMDNTAHGCGTDTLGCDTYCASATQCTWYRAELKPSALEFPVYKLQSSIWESTISITRGSYEITKVLNANKPVLNVNNIGYRNKSIPIVIGSIMHEDVNIPRNIIIYKGSGYEVDACDLNQPMLGRIGEIQKNERGVIIFPMNKLKVTTRACNTYVEIDDTSAQRLIKSIPNKDKMEISTISSDKIVESKITISATHHMSVQLDDFKSILYDPSSCTFDVVATFACDSCDQKPHAILQPIEIKHKGLMVVNSNCSLNTNAVPCSIEPTMIEFNELPSICELTFPQTNGSLIVSFDYVFKGNLDQITTRIVQGSTEEVKSVLMSPDFLTGVVGSITAIGTVTFAFTFVIQVIKIIEMNRAQREMAKA